jgi:hypothetical protein
MAFAILGNSSLQKWGIPLCNFGEFYLAENSLTRISQCAVKGALFSVGANPTRQTSLRPVPPGAVQGGNELD